MPQQINPDDFIITRKRKKYKFALFANSPLCFELDAWTSRAANVVEIGAGTGLFSVELAARHPDKQFVAIDVKGDRLQKGAREAQSRALTNVQFVRVRADQMDEMFEPAAVDELWLTFSDPFPKKRSSGRRLTHPTFLEKYQHILQPDGALLVKHDNADFFVWSLEQLVAQRWRIDELAFDLHDSALPDDYKILTSYERRWLDEGRRTSFLRAHPPL